MAGTDAAWEAWGRQDPYYAVVSHPTFRRDVIDDHRGEFFRDGRDSIATRIAEFERVFGPLPRRRALDFGCGVGRLTLPLAEHFDQVVGLDIAPSMLAEAERNAAAAGATNLTFAPSDDALTGAPGDFDFVHSYIVLQHIPTRRGMRIIDALLAKIAPGGGLSLHVSVDVRHPVRRLAASAVHRVPFAYKVSAWAKGRPWSDPAMQMNAYSLDALMLRLVESGIADARLSAESHPGALTYVLTARRSPS